MNAPLNLPNDNPFELDRAHAVHPWVNFGAFEAAGSLVMVKGQGLGMFGLRWIAAVLMVLGVMAPAVAQERQVLGWGRLASNDATGDGQGADCRAAPKKY